MGAGNTDTSTVAPPAMPQAPDPLAQMVAARKAALRSQAARRGLQSTMLTGPQPGTMLGGS